MSDSLPLGWTRATLGDVAEIHDHRRVPLNARERAARPGPYPYYGANGQVGTVGDFLFEGDFVLLAEDGGYFDDSTRPNAYSVSGQFWVNNHAHILRAGKAIDHRFLLHVLNATDLMPFVSGTTRLKLTQADMRRIPIGLPPLEEQKRIAARIEALFERTRRVRLELARVAPLAVRYRRQAIAKMVAEAAEASAAMCLGDLIADIEAGKNIRCEERPPRPGEKGIVKISAVTWGRFDAKEVKTAPADAKLDPRSRIADGDFLLSRANTLELVGAPVIAEGVPEATYLSDKVLRLRFREPVDEWVLWFLRSPQGRAEIEARSSGNQLSMRNIGQGSLRSIPMPLPPPQLREQLVSKVEQAQARAIAIEDDVARSLALLNHLESRILARALGGELVAQDPGDEPASVTLAGSGSATAAPARGRRARAA